MPSMKHLPLLVIFTTSAFAGFAPESVAGRIFREQTAAIGLGVSGTSERTIVLVDGTRYIALSAASRSVLADPAARGNVLRDPPSDGAYTYAKTSDTTSTLVLSPAAGIQQRLDWCSLVR